MLVYLKVHANILYYANTEHTFYDESQLKCAMKTDAIYVYHPFAGEKLETPHFLLHPPPLCI